MAAIKRYFTLLGFGPATSLVLASLLINGKQTVLEISRSTGIERTKVYRIIDRLLKKNYIVQVKQYKRHAYRISDIDKFSQKRSDYEAKARILADEWSGFAESFEEYGNKEKSNTDIRYYNGVDGIRQLIWNELKAEGELLSFTYRDLQEVVGRHFFVQWGEEFGKRGLVCKDLRTDSFCESTQRQGYRPAPFKGDLVRYLPGDFPNMPISVDVYNDIVAIYDWKNGELFGVEIENGQFAQFMKGTFNLMWDKGSC